MATLTFDGTSSITATKDDTVLITANPQTFTQATDNGSSVTLAFGTQTLTITGTTFTDGGLPNVFVPGGVFAYANSTNTLGNPATGNELVILGNGAAFTQTQTTTADSKVAIFGGLGRSDSIDNADNIQFGGKGSFLVFGNAGNDVIGQNTAFDSTSTVNVTGGIGNDSITLASANTKASIFVGGQDGLDTIAVVNSGTTYIQGGLDSTDGNDVITFNAVSKAGGTSTIFGNGGNDSITVGNTSALDSTSTTTVFGGFGNDTIAITADSASEATATISALGGEGADSITVRGYGNTFITGGSQSGDQSLDGNDTIAFRGTGNTLIYGNVGSDSIRVDLDGTDTTNISIYGGKDGDTIVLEADDGGPATIFVAGGEGRDSIRAEGNDDGAVTVYGGTSANDSADGADTITFGEGSTADIFGNGGDDVINIRRLGENDPSDDDTVVRVYGGIGNDTINVERPQINGDALLNLSGNEGTDTFTILTARTATVNGVPNVTTQATGQNTTITDFSISGGEKLTLSGLGGTPGGLQITSGTFQTLQSALDAASTASGGTAGQHKAAAVVFNGDTYVVIEKGTAGFQAATDQAIKLTGVTDLVGLVGATTVST